MKNSKPKILSQDIREWKSISEISSDVKSGKSSAIEMVKTSLNLIEKHSEYNAIISVTKDRALERAKQIDQKIKNNEKVGRLAGVPFIAKDNFLAYGAETTAASNILKGFNAPYQSTAIELLEAEGAIVVAKANLDAFAHGSSTENSDLMTTKNPHDKTKVPGGSSGGSAAAVMLDLAPFALGTDTGGSIRLPAAFTGAVGYKPTYGLVSRSGVVAMASSTDVIGPIAKTVEECALVLDVITGKDALDSTTIEKDKNGYDISKDNLAIKGQKIAVVKEYMSDETNSDVLKIIKESIENYKDKGAIIEEISLPSLKYALACYYIVCPAEVSSNLSRYDGQKYGYSNPDSKDLEQSYNLSRSLGFGDEAKRRIMIGTYVLSSGYYDAYYKKAQQLRTKLIDEFEDAFSKYDFLIGPTAPYVAFDIGAKSKDPMQMYLADIMTVAANLTGIPAISIPSGIVDGLPVGIQIMSAYGNDNKLLNIAKTMEAIAK